MPTVHTHPCPTVHCHLNDPMPGNHVRLPNTQMQTTVALKTKGGLLVVMGVWGVRAGCPASTVWMPSGGLLCPRWCITYKDGKSSGRHGCFGVVWYDEVQPTVHSCLTLPPPPPPPLGSLSLAPPHTQSRTPVVLLRGSVGRPMSVLLHSA